MQNDWHFQGGFMQNRIFTQWSCELFHFIAFSYFRQSWEQWDSNKQWLNFNETFGLRRRTYKKNFIFQVLLEAISCLVNNIEAILSPTDEEVLQQQRLISSSGIKVSTYMIYVTYSYNM